MSEEMEVPKELKQYYINTFDDKLKQLDELIAKNDLPGIKEFGHKLKGSGSSYGFPEISIIGQELEKLESSNAMPLAKVLRERLKNTFDKIKEDF